LKLAELRGRLAAEQRARWEDIKKGYQRIKRMGGKDDDPVVRVTGTLTMLADQLEGIRGAIGKATAVTQEGARGRELRAWLEPELGRLSESLRSIAQPRVEVQVETDRSVAELLGQYLSLVERTVAPLAKSATQSAFGVRAVEGQLGEVEALVRSLDEKIRSAIARGRPGSQPPPGGREPAG
jgi:hypothetical protein